MFNESKMWNWKSFLGVSRRQHNIVHSWENEQTYYCIILGICDLRTILGKGQWGKGWSCDLVKVNSLGPSMSMNLLFGTVSSWSLNCWAIAWMIFLPSLEQGIRTQLPGIFFCSRILHLFHKPQSPSGLLILRLVWSTFFTTSLLHSLHKCSASLR